VNFLFRKPVNPISRTFCDKAEDLSLFLFGKAGKLFLQQKPIFPKHPLIPQDRGVLKMRSNEVPLGESPQKVECDPAKERPGI
jgi:hypothetical protein